MGLTYLVVGYLLVRNERVVLFPRRVDVRLSLSLSLSRVVYFLLFSDSEYKRIISDQPRRSKEKKKTSSTSNSVVKTPRRNQQTDSRGRSSFLQPSLSRSLALALCEIVSEHETFTDSTHSHTLLPFPQEILRCCSPRLWPSTVATSFAPPSSSSLLCVLLFDFHRSSLFYSSSSYDFDGSSFAFK